MPELSPKLRSLSLATALLIAPRLHAQAPPPAAPPTAAKPLPVFDIVSIKPNKSGAGDISITSRESTFSATNATLKLLLDFAFAIRSDLIFGGPSWVDTARFDIEAKLVDPDLNQLKGQTREQRGAMILPLLTDRFHLQAHRQTKELPVYELVVAKGGPTFKQSPPPPPNPSDSTAKPPGGMNVDYDGHRMQITASAAPLSNLIASLARQLNRTVIDKTGLTAKYDFTLTWTPEDAAPQDSSPDPPAPSIFTALQEQLGLKLQAAKGPVDTLVIDHVELPTEN